MTYNLRNYQKIGVNAVKKAWTSNESPMVVVATGGGKTVMISQLLLEMVLPNCRALVIAHTEEIVDQLFKVISFTSCDVGVVMGPRSDYSSRIVVATRQSLSERRLGFLLECGSFNFVVIDEAHHATNENSYGQIVSFLGATVKRVGFTATPSSFGNSLFPYVVFTWTIFDGLDGNFLVPIKEIEFETSKDLSKKQWVDLVIEAYEKHIYHCKRLCLAFFQSVEISRRVTRAMQRKGYSAAHVDGSTPKEQRKNIIEAYRKGYVRIVCNVSVLTEGFDVPETSAILLARPIKSSTLLSQILGRGFRIVEGKKDCLVVHMC